ncbi:MAG: hypothetical protein RL376_855 [Verrucomicrobiota bacterium]|jgi:hypothetical protein
MPLTGNKDAQRNWVTIAGQGLAGTLLAISLERAGRSFCVYDPGHQTSASRVAIGLVNPVTGKRWATPNNWREKSNQAKRVYREIEQSWGIELITELRIRRSWNSESEKNQITEKIAQGALAPWVIPEQTDERGAWIEGAWRVNLPLLITEGRQRFLQKGILEETALTTEPKTKDRGPLIWCLGSHETQSPDLISIDGETLVLNTDALTPNTVLHNGTWIVPTNPKQAWAGASFIRKENEREKLREDLRESVRKQLVGYLWQEETVLTGKRMTTRDRSPRAHWLTNRENQEGIFNGLGSKGTLLAPGLAQNWAKQLSEKH